MSIALTADPALLFVFGSPRSGTTWLQKSLDAHPEIICRGEAKFVFFHRELGRAAAIYSAFLDRFNAQTFGESYFPGMSKAEFDSLYYSFVEIRLRFEPPKSGARWIGNKDPEHGLVIDRLTERFPDAAYIHLVRDPRDVVVSMWTHLQRVNPDLVAKTGSLETYGKIHMAEWAGYVGGIHRTFGGGDYRFHEIRYEDLHKDPAPALTGVFDFLEVDRSDETVETVLEAESFERASGRKRGEEDARSFYRKGVIGDWRNNLSEDQAAEFLALTDGQAARFGYV